MEAALRKVSVESGEDPRGAALVVFGGAGGLHACALAAALGMPAAIWPRDAGVLCALGALEGGSRRERSRSVLVDAQNQRALASAMARLEARSAADIHGVGASPREARTPCGSARARAGARVDGRGVAARLARRALPCRARTPLRIRRHATAIVQVVTLEVGGWLPAASAARATCAAHTRAGGAHDPQRVQAWHDGRAVALPLWQRDAAGRLARR